MITQMIRKKALTFATAIGMLSLLAQQVEAYLSPQEALLSLNSEDTGHFHSGDYSITYTGGQGLGYSRGYTSLDLFFPFPLCNNEILTFLDLRGHVLTNGHLASNAGLGVRWLDNCHGLVWGTYAFYDYYQSYHKNYHEVTIGLETMADCVELRVNAYIPVGKTKTSLYTFHYPDISLDNFLMKGRMEVALKGFDAELGYHIAAYSCFNFYAGIGPYFYWGKTASTTNAFGPKHVYALGGNARINTTFFEYIVFNFEVSYDTLYKWTAQATVGVNLPFDFFGNTQAHSIFTIADKLYDNVLRNEIIVTKKVSRHSSNPEILNPEHNP